MTALDLSPRAQTALVTVLMLTLDNLLTRLDEAQGLPPLTDAEGEAAMQELEAAGLVKRFPAEAPGEEAHVIPAPQAFSQGFELFFADFQRAATQHQGS